MLRNFKRLWIIANYKIYFLKKERRANKNKIYKKKSFLGSLLIKKVLLNKSYEEQILTVNNSTLSRYEAVNSLS